MKSSRTFYLIFACLLSLELFVVTHPQWQEYRIFSKSFIVGSLLVYIFTQHIQPRLKKLLILGLIFSLGGDIFLLFEGETYFMLGLLSFLVAHIFYIVLFIYPKGLLRKKSILFISTLVGYAFFILSYMGAKLGTLLPYVLAYMIVLMCMVASAFSLKFRSNKQIVFRWALIGAALFAISDSLLAWNKFYAPISHAGIWVMSTYALAQFSIVLSVVKGRIALKS
ncbi:MAG: lysoplasmalogenase [Flavobacteriaceae bacterium]|nr:lysoplasmalogenase [Flavobacteriaceae bacterium]